MYSAFPVTMEHSSLFPYADLKDRDLRRDNLIVGEGRLVCTRLIESDLDILSVLCTPRCADEFTGLAAGRFPVTVCAEDEIAEVAGFKFHRGVLAAARRPVFRTIEQVLPSRPPFITVCAGIATSENLGSIVRTAAALGSSALILDDTCCDPYSRRVLKVSVGSVLSADIAKGGNAAEITGALTGRGYRTIGAVVGEGAVPIAEYVPGKRAAVVFGPEATGLSDEWTAACDDLVTIPMTPPVDSLNVGVAAGIILYDIAMKLNGNPGGR